MSLIHRLLDKIYFVEEIDVVRAEVTRKTNGEPDVFIEPFNVKDISKVRMNRIRTEINDVCIPYLEDLTSGVISATAYYRRRITYLFGIKFSDEPILENILDYENGNQETRWVEY